MKTFKIGFRDNNSEFRKGNDWKDVLLSWIQAGYLFSGPDFFRSGFDLSKLIAREVVSSAPGYPLKYGDPHSLAREDVVKAKGFSPYSNNPEWWEKKAGIYGVKVPEWFKVLGNSRANSCRSTNAIVQKAMNAEGASAVHYMRGKDGRLLFKADGTTIGNAISEKAVNGAEVENTRTLPVSKQAWTECELKGIEAMKKYLASHKGVLPRTIKEVDDVLGIIPDIDVTEKQNVMSYFKYGRGKSLVANSMKDDVAKFKEGDRVVEIPSRFGSMGKGTVEWCEDNPKEPQRVRVRFDRGGTWVMDIRDLRAANSRGSKWVILYRDGGKEKIEAPSHDAAKKVADEKSKSSGRGYTSVIVDDGVDYDRWQFFNAKACNSTNPIVRKAMNAVAKNYKPTSEFEVGDTVRFKDSVRSVPHDETYKVVKVEGSRITVRGGRDGSTSIEFSNNLEIV